MTSPALPDWPRLGLGCARVGSFNNPASLGESIALIRQAAELGLTLFDTADIYGQGDSERAIGTALRNMRDRTFVVTKGGRMFSPKMRALRPLKPLLKPLLARTGAGGAVTARREGNERTDWSRAHLEAALDASLRRLRMDRVDAFLLHSPPAELLTQSDLGQTLERIGASGRAARVGVACDDIAGLEAALTLPRLGVLELPWDLIATIDGQEPVRTITARAIPIIARSVIQLQPGTEPIAAIARAVATPVVTTTLVGSGRIDRIQAIAARLAASEQSGAEPA